MKQSSVLYGGLFLQVSLNFASFFCKTKMFLVTDNDSRTVERKPIFKLTLQASCTIMY